MGKVAVSPRSRKEIEKIANRVRKLLDYDDLRFPIVTLIEILGEPSEDGDVILNYEIVENSEMPDEYATYSPKNNTIRIRESVYDGACKGNGRDRFTLAHEFGHFMLHSSQDYQFARTGESVPAYKDPEWQANTFASMLLMPRDKIHGMSVEEVASACGTSMQAAAIALKK